jgi:hypothetical protein
MVASWSDKEMATIENQLDSYRPIQGFRMPADCGGAAGAEGRRRKASREDAMGALSLVIAVANAAPVLTPAEHPYVQAERPQLFLCAL